MKIIRVQTINSETILKQISQSQEVWLNSSYATTVLSGSSSVSVTQSFFFKIDKTWSKWNLCPISVDLNPRPWGSKSS
ncbi:MAG: hypothetical protein IPL31_06390 [Saprospiraceae bacterium]|nr:hypothetical protein [Saprospiraceae bacterium]